jgi:ubiquinone/menaquinone biosynthesis C-methylase UbiE
MKPTQQSPITHVFDRHQAAYSNYAKAYDVAVKVLPTWKTWIKSVLPHIQGPHVLEASFGTGYLLTQYADQYEVSGIDLNETMVETAKQNLAKRGQKAYLRQANVESLPYPDQAFDTIVNTMAFSGYPDGDKAMSEFKRVLKPGGKILLVDFVYPEDNNLLGTKLTAIMEKAGDIIRDLDALLLSHELRFRREVVGGFGAVCLFIADKER